MTKIVIPKFKRPLNPGIVNTLMITSRFSV
jgi:hypothetical protein